jgi:hypothetical protein
MKRKADTPPEGTPAAKAVSSIAESTNWRKLDVAKLNRAAFALSKGKFGGWSGSWTYGEGRAKLVITGPAMRVLHDPSVWDNEKALKFGADKKELDPERKNDKWNVELAAPADFRAKIDAVLERVAALVHEQLEFFLPKDTGMYAKNNSASVIASKFYEVIKFDEKTGEHVFKLTGRCEVGATSVPLVLEDRDGNALPPGTGLGRGSVVAPVFTMDSSFINKGFQNIKVYVEPVKFVVLEHVAPQARLEPASVRAALDADE